MLNTLVSTELMDRTEWLAWRKKGIGGSDASVICGVNKYKSVVELWMEKTRQIEPKESGEAAYWGNILEPIVREEFAKRTGLEVGIEKSILQHPQYPFMLANLDGIIINPVKKCGLIFEAKTASIYNAHEWELNIPEHYQLQVQHYMAVTGFIGAYVAVLIAGNQFKYYYIERDEEIIKLLIRLERIFWNCVEKKKPPKLDGSIACSELIDRLYPKGASNQAITLPEEALKLIQQYEEAKSEEEEAILKKDEASNKLKNMLGESQLATVNGRRISWTNVASERLNTKALKEEKPEIYSMYASQTTYRRFGIR